MNIKFIFIFILFQTFFINIFCENYCVFGESCLNSCNNCGNDNNFESCNYYNLFCETHSGIKFYEEYESKYIEYFSQNNQLNNICSNNNIKIDSKKSKTFELLKINHENDQNFLKNQKLHCYYEFENNYYKESDKNVSLIIEHKNDVNNNIINFMIIIMLYSQANTANIFDLNKNNLNNNIEIIDLKYYSGFTIYIDIDKIENIKDTLSISLNFINNSKLSPIYILLIILGGLILIILIILALSIIKSKLKRNQRQTNNNNNNNINQEEIEKKEKIKKIKQLFDTELVPQYYSKELDDKEFDGCPICLKKYRNNVSKIVIVSCNHIFHYKCIYDWLINNKHWKCPICNFDLTNKVKLMSRSIKYSDDQINVQKLNLNHGIVTQTSNDLMSLNINTNN